MFNRERLNELETSAELLVAQAEIYRGLLRADSASLQHRLGWLNRLTEKLRPANPWLLGGAIAAGLLVIRGWGRALRWVPAAISIWRVARSFLGRNLPGG